MERNIVAGVDLGTTKVCAIIGEIRDNNIIDILGFGRADSEGLTRGIVTNLTKTAESVKEAMDIAINRAGIMVENVNVGVAGEHIKNVKHKNYVTVNNSDREITEDDLKRLELDVRSIKKESDKQILHIIPEEYFVDEQFGVKNPVGMTGSKLEAVNNVIFAQMSYIDNIKRSIERAGYSVLNYILQPLASSFSVLEDSEKDLGVLLIDIGGGTTDIAIFENNSLKYSKVFGIGGRMVTNDIRETLGIVISEAEKIKLDYGYATASAIIRDDVLQLQGVGAKRNTQVHVSLLTQIISARMRELFQFIDMELKNLGFKNRLKAGVVLTGGGSLLKGCTDLAEEVFGIPARIGVPLNLGAGLTREIETPEFATVTGLIRPIPGLTSSSELINYKPRIVEEPIKQQQPVEEEPVEEVKVEKPKVKTPGFFSKMKDLFEQL